MAQVDLIVSGWMARIAKYLREEGKCVVYFDPQGQIHAVIAISRQADYALRHLTDNVIGVFDHSQPSLNALREELAFFYETNVGND